MSPFGRDHDRVGVLDTRLLEHGDVDPVADDEPPGPVLAEPVERVLALVDHGDLPAAPIKLPGNSGATRPHPTTIAFIGPAAS